MVLHISRENVHFYHTKLTIKYKLLIETLLVTCYSGNWYSHNLTFCHLLLNITDINECSESDPCPLGECHNTKGSYTCSCPFGWQQSPDGSCRPGGEITLKGSHNIPVMDSVREAEWSVVAGEGKVVHVNLGALGLRPTADGRNFVELKNGRHKNSITMAKFNGTGPADFTTVAPDVYIVLHSEDSLGSDAVIQVTDESRTGQLAVVTNHAFNV